MTTWTAWTFRIKDKAYKHVQPHSLELMREKAISETSGMLWWKTQKVVYTGRWAIFFRYNRGPWTVDTTDRIMFERESEARFWFNQTYESIFIKKRDVIPPPPKPKPKKPKKNKPNLRLL